MAETYIGEIRDGLHTRYAEAMSTTFADAFFYLSLVNADDQAHDRAVAASEATRGRFVTSAWVHFEQAGFRALLCQG